MENKEIVPVPQENSADFAHRFVKAGLSAFPVVGGLMGELLEMCITPQYQRRMDEWCQYVNRMLAELLDAGVRKDAIFDSEEFLSLFTKNTKAYMENIEAYKSHYYRRRYVHR